MKYVLYHSNCYDGFGAAYAAWKKFGNSAKYIPVSYGTPPPEMPDASEIYIVDFSYDEKTIVDLSYKAKVVVLDHHKTAEENLRPLIGKENPMVEFDMNRSGALIAWEYFHGDAMSAHRDPSVPTIPQLIAHISDRDLWKFEMQGSKEVHAALVSTPFDFEVWDKLDVPTLIQEGAGALKFQTQLVQNIINKSWIAKVGDHDVPVVNTSNSWSEVGEALLAKYPDSPFAASFTAFKEITMWSLRSRAHEDFDVSAVAKKFGGGGHKNAAGFQCARV